MLLYRRTSSQQCCNSPRSPWRDVIYNLGYDDSDIVIAAAREYGARGVEYAELELDAKVEMIRSRRNYEAAAEAIPGAIGLSSSTVSRGFVQARAAKLREMQERGLSGEDVVAMFLDGKTFADATMVVALGITLSGEKHFLGFVETQVLPPFLRSLLERGLDLSQGLLVMRVVVHRCQWHYADLRIMPTPSLESPRAAARVTLRSA
jgi:hypothetical protein